MLGCLRLAAVLALCASPLAGAATAYKTEGQCGGFPRIALKTAPGLCVGLVASELRFPRGIAALPDGSLVVAEMGGWEANRGRLTRLVLKDGKVAARTTLLQGLDRPHGVRLGPDGRVYVGEAGGVFRIDSKAAAPAREWVVGGNSKVPALPTDGRHPLRSLALGNDGALYVNLGSFSDHCERADGGKPAPDKVCPEAAGAAPRGVVMRYPRGADGQYGKGTVHASGLRNSLALAVEPRTGALYQGENSRDSIQQADPKLSDAALPHDELNRIEPGAHYGWPYCFDNRRASPEYPTYDCKPTRAPARLLAPHAAPLGMLFVPVGAKAPAAWQGALVIAYHGYRSGGHRIVTLPFDAGGRPQGKPRDLVSGWDAQKGVRPMGTPVELALDAEGALYVTEDRNGTVLTVRAQP